MHRSTVSNRIINPTIKALCFEGKTVMFLLLAGCVFVSPVEKKEKRTVKPRELTPFEGMEVTT